MALDTDNRNFLDHLSGQDAPSFNAMNPKDARGFFSGLQEIIGPGPEVLRSEEVGIVSGDGAITLRIIVPSESAIGIIVYLHGGGWVVGGLDDYDSLARHIAIESNCTVVLVGYRLAPEHPFPAAVIDALAALRWASKNRIKISGGRSNVVPLIVAGDSAGGNLAAVVARKATEKSEIELLMQVLIYPVTQFDTSGECYTSLENQGLLGRDDMAWFWDQYVPDHESRSNPDASPLLANDLSKVPSAIIIAAENDVLRDEGVEYARRLKESGVEVVYQEYSGQIHGFFTILNAFPAADLAREFLVKEIKYRISVYRSQL